VSQNVLDEMSPSALRRARRLVSDEKIARGIKTPEAIKIVAREAGLLPGTLERLFSGRLKHIERIAGHIDALLDRKLTQKISNLQHELYLARAARSVGSADLDRAEATLEEARRALGKA
jgi:hypothetical protein